VKRFAQRNDSGFSIAELLMALTIMAILAAIVIPTALGQKSQAVDTTMRTDLMTSSVQMETLLTGWRGVPPAVTSITTSSTTWTPTPSGQSAVATGKVTSGNTLTGTIWTDGSYCLQSDNSQYSLTLNFRSDTQAITSGTCPATALGGASSLPGSTAANLPGVAGSITATSPSNNTVTVTWGSVTGATSYTVVLSGISSREVSSGTTTTFTGVNPGLVTAIVYARNSNGAGPGVSTTVSVSGTIVVMAHTHPLTDIIGSDALSKGKMSFIQSVSGTTAVTTASTTPVTLTAISMPSFVAVAGRLYKVTFTLPNISFGAAGDKIKVAVLVNGTAVQSYYLTGSTASGAGTITGIWTFTATGTTTVTFQIDREAGTGTDTVAAGAGQQALVEDIGLA
jgi:prepilin-type N-terminal cleavage/methylation domain-containing protein